MPSSIAGVATNGLRELLFFAGLLFCFGVLLMLYLSYLVQDIILHQCTTASVSTFQLWVGSTFCLQGPHAKTDEGSSCVSIFSLFLNMRRIDFLYILLSSFLFSLFSFSSPPSQSKSVCFTSGNSSFFHGVFCYMLVQRKQEDDAKWHQEKENGAHPVLNTHRTAWS